jgi:2,4-dienoyl-CoA reductase-like NADH-dependent reductase (Old Yellow Enzyme family)
LKCCTAAYSAGIGVAGPLGASAACVGGPFSGRCSIAIRNAMPNVSTSAQARNTKRKAKLSSCAEAARAESDLAAGKCDLIAVGKPFLANPDLVERWKTGAAVNAPDATTFYTPGAKGYTDYPALTG